jgi:hypothetical protein
MRMKIESGIRAKVSDREGSFEFLARQISALHKDLLAFRAKTEKQFGRLDARFRKIDTGLRGRGGRFAAIERELGGLRADLPKAVRKAARDALRGMSGP